MPTATAIEVELAKWEQHPTQFTPAHKGLKPGNPYVFREFPKMLYRAQRIPGSGKWATSMPMPQRHAFERDDQWNMACQAAEQFTKSCQMVVGDRDEQKKAEESGMGWRETQALALEWAHGLQKDVSTAAAERHASDLKMSEKARAEARKFDDEHFGHQAEVKEKPAKRRGRRAQSAA